MLNAVAVYTSGESESEEEKQVTKKQRKEKNWIVLTQFANAEEAENYLKSENTWSRNYTRTRENGKKYFYRCNKVRKRGPQCNAELCFLYVNGREDVIAYQTDSEHNHDMIGTRDNYGIDEKTKLEIDKLIGLRLKPKAILETLSNIEGVKLPSKKQLNNYLANRRIAVFGQI